MSRWGMKKRLSDGPWMTKAVVDTCRLLPLAQQVPREQRHRVFCASGSAEDEHHFVFDCPAYCAIRNRLTNIFWGPAPTLSSFCTLHDPKVIARFLRECSEHRNTLVAVQSGHSLYFNLECVSCEHLCFRKCFRTFGYLGLTFSVYWCNGHGWPQRPLKSNK